MTHEASKCYSILSSDEELNVHSVLDCLIHGQSIPDLSIIKQAGWIAVPVESASHFDSFDIACLIHAMHGASTQYFYVIPFEGFMNVAEYLKVTSSVEGITYVNKTYSFFNIIMVAENASWLCIATVRDYFIYVGLPEFIEAAVGRSIEAQYLAFHTFATNPIGPDTVRNELVRILHTCRIEYAHAEAGEPIELLL